MKRLPANLEAQSEYKQAIQVRGITKVAMSDNQNWGWHLRRVHSLQSSIGELGHITTCMNRYDWQVKQPRKVHPDNTTSSNTACTLVTFRSFGRELFVEVERVVGTCGDRFERRNDLSLEQLFPVDRRKKWMRLQLLNTIRTSTCKQHNSVNDNQIESNNGWRALHSAGTNRLVVPPVRLSTDGSRSFPVAAAQIWNSLPEHIVSAPTLQSFSRHLKTF